MAIITINPLDIIDGDDITVIDLAAVTSRDPDPDSLVCAIAEVQHADVPLTRRLLACADAHPGVAYALVNPDGRLADGRLPTLDEAARQTTAEGQHICVLATDTETSAMLVPAVSAPGD